MAVPKRRHSVRRRDLRRTHNSRLETPSVIKCPQCHAHVLPHTVCGSCGYYDKKKVIEFKEEA